MTYKQGDVVVLRVNPNDDNSLNPEYEGVEAVIVSMNPKGYVYPYTVTLTTDSYKFYASDNDISGLSDPTEPLSFELQTALLSQHANLKGT